MLMGQTWSTFSVRRDHQDLDFEGINGENVIRQPAVRYTWQDRKEFEWLRRGDAGGFLDRRARREPDPRSIGRAVWRVQGDRSTLQGSPSSSARSAASRPTIPGT